MIVVFKDVGRLAKSWSAVLPEISVQSLEHEVLRKGALPDRQVEFDIDDDASVGSIFLHGVRPAGTFEVVCG